MQGKRCPAPLVNASAAQGQKKPRGAGQGRGVLGPFSRRQQLYALLCQGSQPPLEYTGKSVYSGVSFATPFP